MRPMMLFGLLLFVFGFAMIILAIAGVEGWARDVYGGDAWNMIVPLLGALSLVVGGLLLVLSFGNWRHPRSHTEPGDQVVNPEGFHKMKHV